MLRTFALALLLAQPAIASAQSTSPVSETAVAPLDQRAADAIAVLRGEKPAENVFAPSFLAAVPAEQLAAMTSQLEAQHGKLQGLEIAQAMNAHTARVLLRFERALGSGVLVVEQDAPYRISGLRITGVETLATGVDELVADFAALDGTVNAWFAPLDGGEPLFARNADTPLALGSTFKFYVLAALQRAIAEGAYRWDDVVPLAARSYPGGIMQRWSRETPVTLSVLATMMMMISDNTATDGLIEILGRETLEAEMRRTNPQTEHSLPFLTTREFFEIKTDPDLRERYAAADEASRRALLSEIEDRETPLEAVSAAFAGAPLAIDRIEWFATPEALGRLLSEFTGPEAQPARDILATNPGGLSANEAAHWNFVGFKGGSEPGVLNLTWLLQDKTGRWYIATVGWNHPGEPISQDTLLALGKRMIALAR